VAHQTEILGVPWTTRTTLQRLSPTWSLLQPRAVKRSLAGASTPCKLWSKCSIQHLSGGFLPILGGKTGLAAKWLLKQKHVTWAITIGKCSYLGIKHTEDRLAVVLRPDPLGELAALPQTTYQN